MNLSLLVKLTARAWSLDILGHMSAGVPGRQAALLQATGASRNAFAHSMAHLLELGLVERNPGHGHPLRPEFRLTTAGTAAGITAQRIRRLVPDPHGARLLRKTWSLPVLAVCQAPQPFSQIRSRLDPITDRALSQSLQGLQAQNWIARQVDPAVTPLRPLYVASQSGQAMASALQTGP